MLARILLTTFRGLVHGATALLWLASRVNARLPANKRAPEDEAPDFTLHVEVSPKGGEYLYSITLVTHTARGHVVTVSPDGTTERAIEEEMQFSLHLSQPPEQARPSLH